MSKADERRRERRAQSRAPQDVAKTLDYRTAATKVQSDDPGRDVATWLLCGYLTLIVAAYVAILRLDIMLPGSSNRDRVFFLVTDAATLTGFPQALSYRDTFFGASICFALTLAGALMSLIVGGMAAVRILRLPYSDRQIRRAAYLWTGASILVGVLGLIPRGWHEDNTAILGGFFRTLAAFSNSGVYFGRLPGVTSWQTQMLLMPLSILGGFGLPVLMEMVDWVRTRRAVSRHTLTVVTMSATIYIVSFLLFAGIQATVAIEAAAKQPLAAGVDAKPWVWDVIASSSVAALNSRTTGFAIQPASTFPTVMQWLLIVTMFIGASPAGTGGGVKTTTLVELFRGVGRAKRDQPAGRGVAIAAAWLGLYVGCALVVFLLLLWTQSDPADRLFFQTISAISNVGLSHDRLSTVGPGLFILSAAMLFGRVAPLLILWWMAQSTSGEELAVG